MTLAPIGKRIQFDDGQVFDSRNPTKQLKFADVIKEAYEQRVNLGERGFYATPGVDFNRDTGRLAHIPLFHQRRRMQRSPH